MKIIKFASISFLIGFLLSQLSCNALAQDYPNSRDYDIEDFSRIHLEGGYKVVLKQGREASLTISASDNEVFDYYNVSSGFSELCITMKDRYLNFDRLTLYITFVELEEIHIEGGVKLETVGYINVDDIDIKVEGGAKIAMRIKANNICAVGEGGILFDFVGDAGRLDAKLSGAAHFDADELKAKEVEIKIEGVGTGSVYATDKLWAKIEGVGKITYRGNPVVHKSIEGVGSVKKK